MKRIISQLYGLQDVKKCNTVSQGWLHYYSNRSRKADLRRISFTNHVLIDLLLPFYKVVSRIPKRYFPSLSHLSDILGRSSRTSLNEPKCTRLAIRLRSDAVPHVL